MHNLGETGSSGIALCNVCSLADFVLASVAEDSTYRTFPSSSDALVDFSRR